MNRDIDLENSYSMLKQLDDTAKVANNGDTQVKTIASGFKKFWA